MTLFSTPLFVSTLPRVFDATFVGLSAQPALAAAAPMPGTGHTAPLSHGSGIDACLRADTGGAPAPTARLDAIPHG
ncbi:MAG: hypothetical protein ACU0CO_09590 [Shimia sp.]